MHFYYSTSNIKKQLLFILKFRYFKALFLINFLDRPNLYAKIGDTSQGENASGLLNSVNIKKAGKKNEIQATPLSSITGCLKRKFEAAHRKS